MGDGIKVMYDDHNDYETLCDKYGQKPVGGPTSDYSVHERWIQERFEKKVTELDWEAYLNAHKKQIYQRRIVNLQEEIKSLEELIAEL